MIVSSGLKLADGRYEFGSLIAVGGMGEVWRGEDMWASRTVAIKVLRPEFTGDEASLHRLRTEAHNAAMLNHPNIARVYDYREEEGTGYLVLEYVPGQSLADVLAAQSTMPAHQLIDILHQCAEGLFAAHRAGVVHRDVKPGNILLGPNGTVKLTDFGISVCLGQAALTATGKVMGTAQYLAPEQALGKPATPAGDMYALGIIAYECLAGTRPFNSGGDVDIALAQVRQPPPPLPSWVARPLRDLVVRLLAKDPAKRPATCGELAHILLRLRPAPDPASPETSPVDIPIQAPSQESRPAETADIPPADTAGLAPAVPTPPAAPQGGLVGARDDRAVSPITQTDVAPPDPRGPPAPAQATPPGTLLGEQAPVAAPDHAPATPLAPALATTGDPGEEHVPALVSTEDTASAPAKAPAAIAKPAPPSAFPRVPTPPPPVSRGRPPTRRAAAQAGRPPSSDAILARRRRRPRRPVRAAVPFALLLLCLAAIIGGILLSGADNALLGAAPYSNSATLASCATDSPGRGIIQGDTLIPRSGAVPGISLNRKESCG
ncbi:MAG: serine/threonine protein kinase [Bifidobacteriaceae bacterium]|nr:serine/threonine protein kinase [Bifidobacteriaceae bacterium]